MRCSGFYVGAVMHGYQVANIRIYVVDKPVEPLISGAAAEALGIITLNTGTDVQIENTERNIRRVASGPEVK